MVDVHKHNGIDTPRLDPRSVIGFFETVDAVPTLIPRSFLDQIKIYSKIGEDTLLYVYDTTNGVWEAFNFYTAP